MGGRKVTDEDIPVGGKVVPEWSDFPYLQESDFAFKVSVRQRLQKDLKRLEEKLGEINKEIEADLIATQQKTVKVGELKVVRCSGRSASHVDGVMLVTKGVDPDIVRECTVSGTAYTYIQVIDPRNKKPRAIKENGNADGSE